MIEEIAICGLGVIESAEIRPGSGFTALTGETGAGKDIGIRGPMELLALAGLQRLVGPSIWKSDAGLRQALVREPSHVCLIDEFTQFLRVSAGGPGQIPPHIAGIKTHLLEFYSAASSIHVAAAYADEKHQPPPILEPNLCIYGVGTPRDLGASFTRGAMSDGFLNRWLVFFSDEALPPAQQSPTRKPPIALVAAVRALEERTRPVAAGGMSLVGAGGSTTATGTGCRQIEVTTEAVARLNAIGEECDSVVRSLHEKGDPIADLWIRLRENATKLAMLRAASDELPRPVDLADVEWGYDVAMWTTRRLAHHAEQHIADSPIEASTKRLLRTIEKAGREGLTGAELCRKAQWLDKSTRTNVLATLAESGQIVVVTTGAGKRGRPGSVVVSAKYNTSVATG